MKSEPCNTAPLVEAQHDGRLGPDESASVLRHLGTCASCACLASDLATLGRLAKRPAPEPTALEVRRTRMRLLGDVARGERVSSGRTGAGAIALGVAAMAAIAASLFFSLSPGPVRGVLSPLQLGDVGSLRLVTEVRGAADAELTRTLADGLDLVILREGSVEIRAKKLALGERFVLRTTDAEVEVRGTIFSVKASSGRLVGVSVTEGRVEVRPRGEPVQVEAGGAWTAPAPPAESDAQEKPARRRAGEAAPGGGTRAPRRPALTSSAFRDAVSAMERGDYGAAHAQLQRYADDNPADPRAEDAAFLAILSLQRGGRPEKAADAARAYLARFPAGVRRAEAAVIANDAAGDGGGSPQ